MKKFIIWTPRILMIAFILFISMFALDVFGEGYTFLQTLVALFMHLIPSFVLLAGLLIAWKYPLAGAAIFFLAGVAYIIMAWEHITWWLIIAGPAFLISALLATGWFLSKKRR